MKPHIRDSIAIFAAEMDRKLTRDDALKPAWETECLEALRDELLVEFIELDHAMRDFKTKTECADGKELMLECCDVALYSMMIFSQLHPLTRHNRRGSPVHRIPRIAAENHLVWEQNSRKENGKITTTGERAWTRKN